MLQHSQKLSGPMQVLQWKRVRSNAKVTHLQSWNKRLNELALWMQSNSDSLCLDYIYICIWIIPTIADKSKGICVLILIFTPPPPKHPTTHPLPPYRFWPTLDCKFWTINPRISVLAHLGSIILESWSKNTDLGLPWIDHSGVLI